MGKVNLPRPAEFSTERELEIVVEIGVPSPNLMCVSNLASGTAERSTDVNRSTASFHLN